MAEVKLQAEKREQTGKSGARKTRASGLVPGVLYGRGMESIAIAVERRALLTAFHTDAGLNVLLDLEVDGTNTLAITRELQRDPVKGTVMHADFVKVDRKQAIEVEVPVHLVGESAGVKEGGVLEHPLFQLRLRCLPTNVPENIEANITHLNIGDVLRVSELTVPTGVEILNDPEVVVASVAAPISEEELEAMEAEAGIEAEAPEEVEEAEAAEVPEGEEEAPEEAETPEEAGEAAQE
jgi:large subunit ribosomal protein L25